jgi:hypothetical protein
MAGMADDTLQTARVRFRDAAAFDLPADIRPIEMIELNRIPANSEVMVILSDLQS